MRISKKCRHGLRIMLELAGLKGEGTMTLRELAQREATSEKYLWQVMSALTSAGLVRAARGSQGGYRLASAPRSISLKDMVFALDGPCKLVGTSNMGNSERGVGIVEGEIWARLEKSIVEHLDGVSLKGLRERCDQRNHEPDYVI